MENNNNKNLGDGLNDFLDQDGLESKSNPQTNQTKASNENRINGDKSILERINKKIIIEDGRQLLV